MKKSVSRFDDTLNHNLESLQAFDKRVGFHDMVIDSIRRLHGRVLIDFEDYVLVLLGVSRFSESIEGFPTAWIDHRIEPAADFATLIVNAECGVITAQFQNLRLIGRSDMRIVIPSLDP